MVKKRLTTLLLAAFAVASWALLPQSTEAATEWTVLKTIDLKAAPLDVAPSLDGEWIFILTPGELQTYSLQEGKITDQIPVDKDFDRIASLPRANTLTISSSTKKTFQIVMLQPVYKIDVTNAPFKGPRDAPVTIVVFDDYQCTYCKGFEPFLQQVLEKYPKEAKLVIKQWPLPIHDFARKAATAALAASKQGKFWEIHSKLFANQEKLSDAKVEEIARELGLDMKQFDEDLKNPAIALLIDEDIKSADQVNAPGTPAVYVNGKLLNQRSIQGFQQAIDAELKKVK
jgi:protein-disulfide isomerase